MCKCTKSCNKTTHFSLKMKLHRKGNVRNFRLHQVIFFTKFYLYNMAFQSLFSQIIRISELFSRSVGINLCLQRKTARPFSRNQFLLPISASLVGKSGFSQKPENSRTSYSFQWKTNFFKKSLLLLSWRCGKAFLVKQKSPLEIVSSYAWQPLPCLVYTSRML